MAVVVHYLGCRLRYALAGVLYLSCITVSHAASDDYRYFLAKEYILHHSRYHISAIQSGKPSVTGFQFLNMAWDSINAELHLQNTPVKDADELESILFTAMGRHYNELVDVMTRAAEELFSLAELIALDLDVNLYGDSPNMIAPKLNSLHIKIKEYMKNWGHDVGRDAYSQDEQLFQRLGSPTLQGATK